MISNKVKEITSNGCINIYASLLILFVMFVWATLIAGFSRFNTGSKIFFILFILFGLFVIGYMLFFRPARKNIVTLMIVSLAILFLLWIIGGVISGSAPWSIAWFDLCIVIILLSIFCIFGARQKIAQENKLFSWCVTASALLREPITSQEDYSSALGTAYDYNKFPFLKTLPPKTASLQGSYQENTAVFKRELKEDLAFLCTKYKFCENFGQFSYLEKDVILNLQKVGIIDKFQPRETCYCFFECDRGGRVTDEMPAEPIEEESDILEEEYDEEQPFLGNKTLSKGFREFQATQNGVSPILNDDKRPFAI